MADPETLCDDCPPVGYPTDKTRCTPCPRQREAAADVEPAPPSDLVGEIAVEQRHRDAVVAYFVSENASCADWIEAGDNHPLIQAFARFEQSLLPNGVSVREECADETGWLIEQHMIDIVYAALSVDPWPRFNVVSHHKRCDLEEYRSPIRFVQDAGEAIRFARREDADAFATLFGRFLLNPIIAEHCWPSVVSPLSTLEGEGQAPRPLETAPKDGSYFLMLGDNFDGGMAVVHWDDWWYLDDGKNPEIALRNESKLTGWLPLPVTDSK